MQNPKPRSLSLAIGLAAAAAAFASFSASAQTAQSAAPAWTGRTSFGQPDLQGYWTNMTVVPMERPRALGDQAFYTKEEEAAFLSKRFAPNPTEPGTTADVHYQLSDYALGANAEDIVPNMATSLVVDPPNGRIPPPLPAAAEQARERIAYEKVHGFDSAQDRSLSERCIMWSHEVPIVPVGYNSHLQILQSRGYVVIQPEMLPDARIVPLDDRPALADSVRQWLGDSRGHWDGDTLVVETTHFTGKTHVQGMARGLLLSPEARVVERFTRIDPNTIRYRFTVEDTNTWARPWTVEFPMKKTEGPLFEYACQEGNYGLPDTLRGARAEERRAAEAAAKAQSTHKADHE